MKTTQKTYEQINQSDQSQRAVQTARDNKVRRWIILGVAGSLLIAGIVSGAVALARLSKHHHLLQPSEAMAIAKVCNVTFFPQACVSSLSSYNGAGNLSDPESIVTISMILAYEGVRGSWDLVEDMYPKQANETVKAILKDCLDLLQQALDQVNASISRFHDVYSGDSNMAAEAIDDAQTWLSSALTYQSTCTTDEFENVTGEVQKKISENGAGVEKLLRNALALLHTFSTAGDDLSKWKAP